MNLLYLSESFPTKRRLLLGKSILIVCFSVFSLPFYAQEDPKNLMIDQSLTSPFGETEKKWRWKDQIIPLSLIVSGTALSFGSVKRDIQECVKKTNTRIDDYTQHVPIATLYLADALGVKHKNTVWNQTKYLVLSELITLGLTQGIKLITDVDRPNGAAYAFPSGHASWAFAGATVLHQEFKDSNPYWAYSGYLFATSTALLRVTNYRHWISDVLAGAGLGILVTRLVYYFEPLKNWDPFSWNKEKLAVIPTFRINSVEKSIGFVLQF